MRKLRPVALVCAGPVSRTALEDLPKLREQLGAVKAGSYRLASRYVNRLRAGTPVHSYDELHDSSLILINVPEGMIPAVVSDLAGANIRWTGKHVALYQSGFDCSALGPLA